MNATAPRLLRSFTTLASGELMVRGLALVATVHLGRALGVEGFGVIGFAGAVLLFAIRLADLGVELIATREVAVTKTCSPGQLVEAILGLRLAGTALAALLLLIAATLLPVTPPVRIILILSGLALLPLALNVRWFFIGIESPRIVVWATTAGQAAFLAGVWALVTTPSDLIRVPLLQAGGELVTTALLMMAARRRIGSFRPRLDLPAWRAILPMSLPTLGADLARAVVYSFDVVLIGLLLSEAMVGRYVAAARLLMLALTFGRVYYLALLPPLTRSMRGGADEAVSVVSSTARFALLAAMPITTAGIVLATPVLRTLFGPPYVEATLALQLLMPSAVLVIVSGAFRHALQASDRSRLDAGHVAVGAVLNVALNLLLVPSLHLAGAALATTIAEGVLLTLNWRAVTRLIGPPALTRPLLVALAGAVIMGGVLVALRDAPLFVSLPIGCVSYAAIVLSLDWALARQIYQLFLRPIWLGNLSPRMRG